MKLVDKYHVVRRDGTVPDWPFLVIGARDPNAPAALRAYADEAEHNGYDSEWIADIRGQADDFERYRREFGDSDPDAPLHRTDDPETVSRIKAGSKRIYPPAD